MLKRYWKCYLLLLLLLSQLLVGIFLLIWSLPRWVTEIYEWVGDAMFDVFQRIHDRGKLIIFELEQMKKKE